MPDIRDARDAHVVLEAVRLNRLPLIRRRLGAAERSNIDSGNIFVWEESQDDGLLARWTDGRKWSQSRMRGDCLFYEEKIETTSEEKAAKAVRRARRASDPSAVLPDPVRRKDRPAKVDGLTKQTYSAGVRLSSTGDYKKWHLVAYFRGNDYTHLPVIESYDYLRNVRVPAGIFTSSKMGPTRGHRDDNDDSEMSSEPYSPREREFREYQTDRHFVRDSSSSAGSPTVLSSPTSAFPSSTISSAQFSTVTLSAAPSAYRPASPEVISLPPLSTLYPTDPSRPSFHRSHTYETYYPSQRRLPSPARVMQSRYSPLVEEDRRALAKLRVDF
jgi:hypothetical protein